MKNFKEELETAKELALKAGKEVLSIYNSNDFDITKKEDKSPLTKADIAANEIIVSGLKKAFPHYAILTEEEKDNKSRLNKDFVWIIDPIDGTKGFIAKQGEFTVNIALVHRGGPVLGVICIPTTNELFYASKSNGAFYEINHNSKQINVSKRKNIDEMILVKSRLHASEKIINLIAKHKFADVKTSGSSLKGCLIAKGDADVYFRFGNTNEWDICAMDLIIREAEGILTDLNGDVFKYNKDDTLVRGFLASNNRMHKELMKMAGDKK